MITPLIKKYAVGIVGLALSANIVFGASNNGTLGSTKNEFLSQFAQGSILNGSTKAGSVARWYLFNEGHVGYSYSMLGNMNLHSVDVGYSAYIMSIKSASGLRPYFGVEITAPLYIRTLGSSNAFYSGADTGLPGGSNVLGDMNFNGWGVQVPLILGVQARYFYMQAMVGYSYHSITERFYVSDTQNDTSLTNNYSGFTYGAGMGVRVSNVFSVGVRYVMGQLTSVGRSPEGGSPINADSIRGKDFGNRYQRISLIFGMIF